MLDMNVSEALALPSHILEVALQVAIHDREVVSSLTGHAEEVARLKEELRAYAADH
jgi:hypothetical protein